MRKVLAFACLVAIALGLVFAVRVTEGLARVADLSGEFGPRLVGEGGR